MSEEGKIINWRLTEVVVVEEIIRTEKDRVLNVLCQVMRQDRVHVSAQNGSVLQNVDAGAVQTKKKVKETFCRRGEGKKTVTTYLVVMKLDNAKRMPLFNTRQFMP